MALGYDFCDPNFQILGIVFFLTKWDWEYSELGFFGIPIIGHAKLVCPKNPFSKLVSGGKLFAANILSIMSTNNKKTRFS